MPNAYREPKYESKLEEISPLVADPSSPIGALQYKSPKGTQVDCMSFIPDAANAANEVSVPISQSDYKGVKVLGKTDARFGILASHQDQVFFGERPFFLYDRSRTFYVEPRYVFRNIPIAALGTGLVTQGFAFPKAKVFRFQTHYHSWTTEFIERLARGGLDSLLQRGVQIGLKKDFFELGYSPEPSRVASPYPVEDVDFSAAGGYSSYNWELFFHIPLMIAYRMSSEQRFEEAQKWFHYIFDPTDTSDFPSPSKYWRCKPMFEASVPASIEEWIRILATSDSELSPSDQSKKWELRRQIARWRREPFNPHLIARMRIGAYQKHVVMAYLDNLIAWGDQLFRRDTMESINEATQIYLLASRILGERPTKSASSVSPKVQTFHSLQPKLDEFSNALVVAEDSLAQAVPPDGAEPGTSSPPFTLAFCIPPNDKLLGYWDTIADRLFKIRHCMSINGVKRELPLFEAPIDPAILVRAAAAGLDIGTVLNELNAPLPAYRFSTMHSVALQFCNDVRTLGSEVLAAFEKRDAEKLALLQSRHATALLKSTVDIREHQIQEATEAQIALIKLLETTERKYQFYSGVKLLNGWETAALFQQGGSILLETASSIVSFAASKPKTLPYKTVGSMGSSGPISAVTTGGEHEGSAADSWATGLHLLAGVAGQTASLSATLGSYHRRMDDWELQKEVAEIEREQIKKQIAAAGIRVELAKKELRNLQIQIEQEQEKSDHYRNKFSNQQLYDWMCSQLAKTYFQSFRLASDLARKAERCFRRDLALDDSSYIEGGYWDSLRKGLLAGERLQQDLNRMHAAYLENSTRDLEITKNVSLLQLDPLALVKLRHKGVCEFLIPEALFDLDFPGHFLRRIKAVSVTIPCVAGPFTSINGTLTLLKSEIRQNNTLVGNKYGRQPDDKRIVPSFIPSQAIALSRGREDSGMFEFSFRDERYLPFEHAGAISNWRLQLSPVGMSQFDYRKITDVVTHIHYTAKDGGDDFRDKAIGELDQLLNEVVQTDGSKGRSILVSMKYRFPNEWQQLINSSPRSKAAVLDIDRNVLPFYLARKGDTIRITKSSLFAIPIDKPFTPFDLKLVPPDDTTNSATNKFSMKAVESLGNISTASNQYSTSNQKKLGKWKFEMADADYAKVSENLDDVFILLELVVK
jgi:hypothetical protein